MSRLNDHRQELLAQWQQMSQTWDNARTKWRDQARTDFERQYWEPMEKQTLDYLKALESLCEGSRDLS